MPKEALAEKTVDAGADNRLYLVSALVQNEAALKELGDFLKNAGTTVKKIESLGVKPLAFPIHRHTNLTLISAFFTAEPAVVKTLHNSLKQEEYLERFLLTSWRGPIDQPKRASRPHAEAAKKTEAQE